MGNDFFQMFGRVSCSWCGVANRLKDVVRAKRDGISNQAGKTLTGIRSGLHQARVSWFFPMLSVIFLVSGLFLVSVHFYDLPHIENRLSWRMDVAWAYVRGVLDPVEAVPTPIPQQAQAVLPIQADPPTQAAPSTATQTPTITPTSPGPTPESTSTPTILPSSISLYSPEWEKQDWNNCGPASLAIYLRYYRWDGNQFDISDLLKPDRTDRNVNVEELVYYVRNRVGWMNIEYRVGGDVDLLKRFLAARIPVMIEEGYELEQGYWPNDDHWASHYLVLTGYDDDTGAFTAQDTFIGPDQLVSYEKLDEGWQAFNRVYILVYTSDQEETVKAILGPHIDVDDNRQYALEISQAETKADPGNAYTWFNLGSNLVYFDRYIEAAEAYDEARNLGLPQRMFRYQFGPFLAYFHSLRTDDMFVVTEYALRITKNSEEALLWHGWGLYRQGDNFGAIADFRAALEANPYYRDAEYALEFLGASP